MDKGYDNLTQVEKDLLLRALNIYANSLYEFNKTFAEILGNGMDIGDMKSFLLESGLEQVRKDINDGLSLEEMHKRNEALQNEQE